MAEKEAAVDKTVIEIIGRADLPELLKDEKLYTITLTRPLEANLKEMYTAVLAYIRLRINQLSAK